MIFPFPINQRNLWASVQNQRSKIKVKTQSISKSKSISFVLTLQNERETKAQNFKRRLILKNTLCLNPAELNVTANPTQYPTRPTSHPSPAFPAPLSSTTNSTMPALYHRHTRTRNNHVGPNRDSEQRHQVLDLESRHVRRSDASGSCMGPLIPNPFFRSFYYSDLDLNIHAAFWIVVAKEYDTLASTPLPHNKSKVF